MMKPLRIKHTDNLRSPPVQIYTLALPLKTSHALPHCGKPLDSTWKLLLEYVTEWITVMCSKEYNVFLTLTSFGPWIYQNQHDDLDSLPCVNTQAEEQKVFSLTEDSFANDSFTQTPTDRNFITFRTSALLSNLNLLKRFEVTVGGLVGRWFVITSLQLAEETTQKLNAIENNFACILHFTLGQCIWDPVLWNGPTLSIHISFNTSFDYSVIKVVKMIFHQIKPQTLSTEKTVCPCWSGTGEKIRI